MDGFNCWPRLIKRSPSIILILLEPFISCSSALIMDMILSASDFEVKRETTKQELDETRNISPLNCPAAMFFGRNSFSINAKSILN